MSDIAGLVLAGGRSSRMGGVDKAFLTLGDRTLVARAAARLGAQVPALAISANRTPARYAELGLPVLADAQEGFLGPLAGVLAGLRWAEAEGYGRIVSAAADTPFFPRDLVARLKRAETPLAMAAAGTRKGRPLRHPTFALWPVALADDLEAALAEGVRKIVEWTDRHGCRIVDFDMSPHDPFFNVNTPDDLARAERLLAEGCA